MTKTELERTLDEIEDLANDALDPELTREDVIRLMKEIADLACREEGKNGKRDTHEDPDKGV